MRLKLTKTIANILIDDVLLQFLSSFEDSVGELKPTDNLSLKAAVDMWSGAKEECIKYVKTTYADADNEELCQKLLSYLEYVFECFDRCTPFHSINTVAEYMNWLTITLDNCVDIVLAEDEE